MSLETLTSTIRKTLDILFENVAYTNENPTTAHVGGIKKGETFAKASIATIMGKLLYPKTPTTDIVFYNLVFDKKVTEVGLPISFNGFSLDYTFGSSDNTEYNIYRSTDKVKFRDTPYLITAAEIASQTTEKTVTEDTNGEEHAVDKFEMEKSVEAMNQSSVLTYQNQYFKIAITNEDGLTDESAVNEKDYVTFVRPFYYGNITHSNAEAILASTESEKVDITEIVGSATKVVDVLKTTDVEHTSGDVPFFCIPAGYGKLVVIRSSDNFNVLKNTTEVPVTITCADGNVVTYYAYVGDTLDASDTYTYVYGEDGAYNDDIAMSGENTLAIYEAFKEWNDENIDSQP